MSEKCKKSGVFEQFLAIADLAGREKEDGEANRQRRFIDGVDYTDLVEEFIDLQVRVLMRRMVSRPEAPRISQIEQIVPVEVDGKIVPISFRYKGRHG